MYSDRKIVSWTFTNKTISSAGTVSIIKMPDGYRGVFVGCEFYAVTGVTVAADTIYLGSTSDTDAYGTASIPVTPTGSAASVTNTRPTSSGDKGEAQYTEVPRWNFRHYYHRPRLYCWCW